MLVKVNVKYVGYFIHRANKGQGCDSGQELRYKITYLVFFKIGF